MAQDSAIVAASELFAQVSLTPAVQHLVRRLEKGGFLSCLGVSEGAHPFLVALLRQLYPTRALLVVTEGPRTQETFQQDLTTWLQLQRGTQPTAERATTGSTGLQEPPTQLAAPLFYPSWEVLPHEDRLPHPDVISERLETLLSLAGEASGQVEPAPTIVSNVVALLQRTFPLHHIRPNTRTLVRGDRIDPLDLVEWLEAQGYEPEAQVTQKGELSLRGGILDFFPLTSPWPVRLEFFGDELESVRQFDPLTQISRQEVLRVSVAPAGELGILRKIVAGQGLSPDTPSRGAQQHAPALATLVEYLPPSSIVVLCDPAQLAARAEEYTAQVASRDPLFADWKDFLAEAGSKGLTLMSLAETGLELESREPMECATSAPDARIVERSASLPLGAEIPEAGASQAAAADLNAPVSLSFQSLEAYRPLLAGIPEASVAETQRREFFAQLHRWQRQGYAVHLFCNNEGERQRFTELWREYGFESPADQSLEAKLPPPGTSAILNHSLHANLGTLARGFLHEAGKVVVVTDAEVFGRYKVQRPRRLKSPHAQATRSALDIDFTDLEEGDYVVHLQHGIGRYLGLKVLPLGAGTRPTEGTASGNTGQECLVIEYAAKEPGQPPPKLYVPVTEAHLVSKYVGTGKARPPLNTLGGTRWAKAKAQAERAVRDVASELLAIQAARETQPGHAFAPDTPWQREFESAFLYEETPDQLRAIGDTKGDMERPKPMDRLICGDVGFGKTEVAIRAAFKGVMDGRQVAVLVPTTVLAQQHYNTFRERMADYPIRVELLSRFRSRRAQARVVSDLAAGAVDIVIGTHRLLQRDIAFKDLGLVVIDEEQRFGVLHKENFKRLRQLVDVLTLSATPIPRTLYLALTGARDMSTIQTPPHDRLPVETIVTQYDERTIRDAIQRELNRGGQVFFLHNRVMTIEAMGQKLRQLLPQARIVVGHGQMHADDLEEVMTQFVNGEADVLLSTTIIESGLDIPNANTIIIDRADRFGLSDLYQLRGRVGRYKHQAYAYLLLPRHAGLVADVRKRLSAIKQYSTLGSGFKIAMRDLEIRGAGNLLGAEQSGHITAVGFELYCQLLKQSVSSLKGEKVKPRLAVEVRLDFLTLSPGDESANPQPRTKETAKPGPEATGDESSAGAPPKPHSRAQSAAAYIPFRYISDARQRIEVYRKLAQATDSSSLRALEQELRDRFGPLPPPLALLLQVAELKINASEKGIHIIEVKDDRLMLTRNQDYIMVGSKFPRLVKSEPRARLREIKKLLLAL